MPCSKWQSWRKKRIGFKFKSSWNNTPLKSVLFSLVLFFYWTHYKVLPGKRRGGASDPLLLVVWRVFYMQNSDNERCVQSDRKSSYFSRPCQDIDVTSQVTDALLQSLLGLKLPWSQREAVANLLIVLVIWKCRHKSAPIPRKKGKIEWEVEQFNFWASIQLSRPKLCSSESLPFPATFRGDLPRCLPWSNMIKD